MGMGEGEGGLSLMMVISAQFVQIWGDSSQSQRQLSVQSPLGKSAGMAYSSMMFHGNGPCPIKPRGGEMGESSRSGIGFRVHSDPAGKVPTLDRTAGISCREPLSDPCWIQETFWVARSTVRWKQGSDKSESEGHNRTDVPPPWFALRAQPTSSTPPAETTVRSVGGYVRPSLPSILPHGYSPQSSAIEFDPGANQGLMSSDPVLVFMLSGNVMGPAR